MYYDKTHKAVKFEPNQKVMVYFPVAKEGLSYKLLPKWDGPFEIVQQVDSVTYRVRRNLGRKLQIMPVHVQRLKKYEQWIGKNN